MTDYKLTVWEENPIHFEVGSLAEALAQFAYDYEDQINKHDLEKQDLVIHLTKGNMKEGVEYEFSTNGKS